jgi:cytoskeletal protein CcmA (bactofilin family)
VSSEVPEFSGPSRRSISAAGFALGVVGIALAFKLSTGLLFGFDLPVEIEWLNPREWALSLGVAVNALFYAFQNADSVFTDTTQGLMLISFGAAVLFAMGRVFKRGAAVTSMLGVLLAMGLVSSPSYAVDLRKGAKASIPAAETVDDTVLAAADPKAQSMDVAGTIKGDLIAVGDVIVISGTVEGNVVVVARRLEINGTVGGSVFAVGHTVTVSGQVARNVITAGDTISVSKNGIIGGNTITGSREAVIDGKTARDLISAAAILDLRGDIGRNVSIAAGQATVTGSSHVGGDLSARVGKEENLRISEGAVIAGQKNVHLPVATPRSNRYLTVSFYIWQVVRVLGLFVTGLVIFKLIPSLMPSNLASGSDWLKAGGVGFMTLVAVPIAAIIIAFTFIGLPIALITFVLYLIACYLAKIVVAEFVGRSVMKVPGAVSLLVGLLMVVVAVNLPWIGTLINFLLILLGLGAITLFVYKGIARRPAPAF